MTRQGGPYPRFHQKCHPPPSARWTDSGSSAFPPSPPLPFLTASLRMRSENGRTSERVQCFSGTHGVAFRRLLPCVSPSKLCSRFLVSVRQLPKPEPWHTIAALLPGPRTSSLLPSYLLTRATTAQKPHRVFRVISSRAQRCCDVRGKDLKAMGCFFVI